MVNGDVQIFVLLSIFQSEKAMNDLEVTVQRLQKHEDAQQA
jgi:hypothetical protein